MKKFLIAASALVCLMGAPLAAQAATSSSQSSSEMPRAKHATVRHHTAQRHATARRHAAMSQTKKNMNCPPGSQSTACQPSSTGSIR
jgi:Ni/Co efflux regulator RcnB